VTHNPLVEGSSPSGPTNSPGSHGVMASGPGDRIRLVLSIAQRIGKFASFTPAPTHHGNLLAVDHANGKP